MLSSRWSPRPEQCQGKPATHLSDQYSLGVVAYEMLAGKPPYSGDGPYEIMRQHCRKKRPAKLRRDCPEYLNDFITRFLATDPLERYTTRECDSGFGSEVEGAWQEVIGDCVDYLLQGADAQAGSAPAYRVNGSGPGVPAETPISAPSSRSR